MQLLGCRTLTYASFISFNKVLKFLTNFDLVINWRKCYVLESQTIITITRKFPGKIYNIHLIYQRILVCQGCLGFWGQLGNQPTKTVGVTESIELWNKFRLILE